jgi:2-dehydro-3-deoxygluconokinase
MIRIASIGECMIELRHVAEDQLELGFGGDTLNTAVYLARLLGPDAEVAYVTALGDDAYSDAMVAAWAQEGIATGLVARLPGRLPGLYTIRTDARGERSFTYWRSAAAARDLLRAEHLAGVLPGYSLLYLSGITLSILDEEQRGALLRLIGAVQAARGRIAFDGNFRPAGWPDPAEARRVFDAVLEHADIALPTFDDERALFGMADPAACAARLHQLGVAEVVVKLGAEGAWLSSAAFTGRVEAAPVDAVVDSTAAGDSFNAGYLAARLQGEPPPAAAALGARLAARVIGHRGAIIPQAAMADLMPAPA